MSRAFCETPLRAEAACPRRLSAFECGAFAAARTHGLTLAAFAAGLDHARTVPAADALRFGRECGFGLSAATACTRPVFVFSAMIVMPYA